LNEHINDISGEIVAVVVAIGGWIMWAVKRLIGMDQRIGVVECALIGIQQEKQEAKNKVETLMMDVASIKSDIRHNTENTNDLKAQSARILDLLERK
jgi:hypothetical protein